MQDSLGYDHEFLECKATTSVGATVQYIHEGYRQDIGLFRACKIRDMRVEWNALKCSSP